MRPLANSFLEKSPNSGLYGGGILENIGSFFGTAESNVVKNVNQYINNAKRVGSTVAASPVAPINTSVSEPVINASLPNPASVVNNPNVVNSAVTNSSVTNSSATLPPSPSVVNSLFGGYKATKRNRKYVKRWKQGKSIGFTMRSSLKAKGLIPRANGTRRVSKKYQ